MNTLRKLPVREYKRFAYHIKTKRLSSSAARLYEPADEDTKSKEQLEPLVKQPQRPSFVKNIFAGRVDTELLTYPEFLGEKRLKLLDLNTKILQGVVDETIDSAEIDKICSIPENVLEKLRNLKLFGISAAAEHGGLELTHTEKARIYEVLAKDTSVAAMLFSNETLGYKVIARYGNEAQKKKYMKDLASGKKIAAYCANEPNSGSDLSECETYGVYTEDELVINGTKTWVMNADSADVFIVFLKPKDPGMIQKPINKYYGDFTEVLVPDAVNAYLIDKTTPGIVVAERKDTMGVRGLHMCDVHFKDVVINEQECLLGSENAGYDISREFIAEDRYAIGCFALTILKQMLDTCVKFSIKKKLYGDNLCNYGLTQIKLADMALNIYAIESLIYFTTGMADMYENQDCEVENSIVKLFSSKVAWNSVCDGMQLLGGQGYLRNTPQERYFRDLKLLSLFDVSDEVTRTFIALSGLKYISNDINEDVVVRRNPLFHPEKIMKKIFRSIGQQEDNPKLTLKLYEYFHPMLFYITELVEYCVLRFEYSVNIAMARTGVFLVDDQYALNRIAEGVMLIYVMIACTARASRAFCIGSKNADEELVLAETIVRKYHEEFKAIAQGLVESEYFVTDANSKKIADKVLKSYGHFTQEPLELTS